MQIKSSFSNECLVSTGNQFTILNTLVTFVHNIYDSVLQFGNINICVLVCLEKQKIMYQPMLYLLPSSNYERLVMMIFIIAMVSLH